ncbi:Aste57867_2878 [Aphanomyces stellatus]|uniref:Aste57867_2878 protein n=1 Tax=Aphanomyces stellatus TaxID=120398 RepID=A0A485K8L9_9STRA|nr:hypothetical protein As57867_002870 [Aphanomyces stellatus]VFT80063.1 Aste57867_2878 [Aphanomyces stellatus]
MDFGYAKPLGKWLRGRSGKIQFMAPEMFATVDWTPAPADMWALGMMLFTMLTREYMVNDGLHNSPLTMDALQFDGVRGVLDLHPEWQRHVPADLVDLLDAMLCFNPADRLTMDALLLRLDLSPPAAIPKSTTSSTGSVSPSAKKRRSSKTTRKAEVLLLASKYTRRVHHMPRLHPQRAC